MKRKRRIPLVKLIMSCLGLIFLAFLYFTNIHKKVAPYQIQLYGGLSWSESQESSVYALLNPQTEDETLAFTKGYSYSAEIEPSLTTEVLSFYNHDLTDQGFSKVFATGNPETDNYWVVGYRRGMQYVEIQYFLTPYKSGSFTMSIFSGVFEENPD